MRLLADAAIVLAAGMKDSSPEAGAHRNYMTGLVTGAVKLAVPWRRSNCAYRWPHCFTPDIRGALFMRSAVRLHLASKPSPKLARIPR
jgi:hypothetical protein